ncbi:MAG: UDP-N-acetylmuramoyl-L-alanine--D-glutamate ligase [Clostridia bacterium]|nr:UDP-N-acetylmuramoyl-L-alanine--D-glutamate ligase [Clostridia bacterium]
MKAIVIGSGVSGKSALKLLLEKGYSTEYLDEKYLNDDIYNVENNINFIKDMKDLDRLLRSLSFIVVSPGIDLDKQVFKIIKRKKIKVIGELELGFRHLNGDIIAVTGTNGKTTTTSLIKFILDSTNKNVFVGGNIGTAVSSFATQTNTSDISVLECSSYQLESIDSFKPTISAILNISEDHLIRHKTMDNYINIKFNITKNQTENDYLLLNADCGILMQNPIKTNAKILYFSTKQRVNGCYIKNNCIYFNDNLIDKKLVSLDGIKLLGEHNLSNILCSVLSVYLLTNDIKILSNITKFQGISHRIEFIKTINGISFYNDSKATNIDSTMVALSSFKCKINLILGGSEKGYEFDKLFYNLPSNVVNIATFGQTKSKIYNCAKKYGFSNIVKCNTLRDCVEHLFNVANEKEIILLSPACASFDHFSNYEERGNVFKKIVKEIDNNENALFKYSKKM